MFEAILGSASLLRKVIEALKDLVTDANLECHPDALTLQVSEGLNTIRDRNIFHNRTNIK